MGERVVRPTTRVGGEGAELETAIAIVAHELRAPLLAVEETVARLSRHPRIVAVKEATGDVGRGLEVLRLSQPGFVVLSGDDATAAALIQAGARGVISVTANVAARAMHQLCAAALRGAGG